MTGLTHLQGLVVEGGQQDVPRAEVESTYTLQFGVYLHSSRVSRHHDKYQAVSVAYVLARRLSIRTRERTKAGHTFPVTQANETAVLPGRAVFDAFRSLGTLFTGQMRAQQLSVLPETARYLKYVYTTSASPPGRKQKAKLTNGKKHSQTRRGKPHRA